MAKKQEPDGIINGYITIRDQLGAMEWDLAKALHEVKSKKLYTHEHKTWQKFIENNGLFENFKQADRFVWAWEEWHIRLKFPLKELRKYRVSTLGQLPKVKLTREQANEVLKMINSPDKREGKQEDKRKKSLSLLLNARRKNGKDTWTKLPTILNIAPEGRIMAHGNIVLTVGDVKG